VKHIRIIVAQASTTPSRGGLADRYAHALYSLAEDRSALDETVEQMASLGRLLGESADLRRLLNSPLIEMHTARQAIRAVLAAEGLSTLVQDFAGVVASNRRLRALPAIVAAFAALVAEKRGVVVAEVTTAHPMSDLQEQQLRARLIESGYGRVEILRHVDPSLLGGLVLRIGARLYDSSLKSRLQRLQYAMKGAA
jgi:F-type H+-transporting ATPase subunit delta